MQQTVVEWLKEKLIGHLDISERYKKELFEQADKIFENQIIDARDALFHGTPEQYYNETFKSE